MAKEETPTSPSAAVAAEETTKAGTPDATSPAASSPAATSPAAASPLTSTPASPTPGATAGVPLAAAGDPKVAELQAMFPTVDIGVIEVVLESHSGSQDRAIESLLQMTDPDFKPEDTPAAGTEENSQVDLDAQFARALAMQDEENARSERHRARASQTGPPGELPYQPRVRRARRAPDAEVPAASRDLPPGQGDQLAVFEEKAAQFVESGRQTFNSLFNRVKTKYTEYQSQTTQGSESRSTHEYSHEYEHEQGLWGDQHAQQGYDARPTPARTVSATSSQLSSQEHTPIQTRWGSADGGRPSSATGKPPGKIDMAKLGFLPKTRVDLMSSQQDKDPNPSLPGSPSSPHAVTPTSANRSLVAQIPKTPPAETSHHTLGDSDDDDDLEYTRNPFDEK